LSAESNNGDADAAAHFHSYLEQVREFLGNPLRLEDIDPAVLRLTSFTDEEEHITAADAERAAVRNRCPDHMVSVLDAEAVLLAGFARSAPLLSLGARSKRAGPDAEASAPARHAQGRAG
jgi:hypothetical protein